MAKFIYRMQNILNIKYKLEESAKQEYAEARQALAAEEQKLDALKKRKQGYYEAYQASIQGRLDFLEIEENANSMDILDMMIEEQNASGRRAKNWNLPDRRWHARCRNGKCMRS